jgi:hypothetical protein
MEMLGVGERIILKYLLPSYYMWKCDLDSSGVG